MATKRKIGLNLSDNELAKRYHGSGLASKIALSNENSLWLPSSILALNYMLGGGIKFGSVIEIFGNESSGKSLIAKNFLKSAHALGGVGLWNDSEGTFSPTWAKQNGVDLEKTYIYQENQIEMVSDWQADMIISLRAKLTNNEPILLIEDSIAAFETALNMEESQYDGKAEMGNRAKAIYTMLRRRNPFYVKYGVCVIYINQLRKKVGASMYEDPDTTPGGDAMKFFASQRIGIYSGKQIKNEDDEKVGNIVYIRTKKNKVAPPRPNIKGEVYFTEHNGQLGYHPYIGLPEILEKKGILERKKARWYFGDKMIAQGDEKMLKVLTKDKELRQSLLKELDVNTVSKTRKQMSKIGRNLYPINEKKAKKEKEATDEEE